MLKLKKLHHSFGNYYLQSFRNGVDTIEKMNASKYETFTHLSTESIWVQMR